jgi:hypothetical protein
MYVMQAGREGREGSMFVVCEKLRERLVSMNPATTDTNSILLSNSLRKASRSMGT